MRLGRAHSHFCYKKHFFLWTISIGCQKLPSLSAHLTHPNKIEESAETLTFGSNSLSLHVLPSVKSSQTGKITLKTLFHWRKYYAMAIFGCRNLETSKLFAQVQPGHVRSVLLSKKFLPRLIPANFNCTRISIKLYIGFRMSSSNLIKYT